MKGISFITDEKDHKKAIVIDLKTLENPEDEINEFLDVLIAESRANDEMISWGDAKKKLKRQGKL